MGKETAIEWCDSTLNLQMGCDGCELWNPKAGVEHCYAGTLTLRYAGAKGWPDAFEKPAMFPERLDAALRWSDLTGKNRPGKPWLDGMPRLVFLDDMGDTFTESLPDDWLAPLLPRMADSPHQWLMLTKRPSRMAAFSTRHPLPTNVWPMTSVTRQENAGPRIGALLKVRGGGPRSLSVEPMLGEVNLAKWLWEFDPVVSAELAAAVEVPSGNIGWIIAGGESGPNARPCHPSWAMSLRDQCVKALVPFFWKQWGEWQPGTIGGGCDSDVKVMYRDGRVCEPTGDARRDVAMPLELRPHPDAGGHVISSVGKKAAGRLLDGREWNELPELGG